MSWARFFGTLDTCRLESSRGAPWEPVRSSLQALDGNTYALVDKGVRLLVRFRSDLDLVKLAGLLKTTTEKHSPNKTKCISDGIVWDRVGLELTWLTWLLSAVSGLLGLHLITNVILSHTSH